MDPYKRIPIPVSLLNSAEYESVADSEDYQDMLEQMDSTFDQLFPLLKMIEKDKSTNPVVEDIMAIVTNAAKFSFDSYRPPLVKGFVEKILTCEITHLGWQQLVSSLTGFLRINLNRGSNLKSEGPFSGQCDSYVQFSVGCSLVRSEVVRGEANPEWNSVLYIPIRKRDFARGMSNKLTVQVYDKDTRLWSVYRFISRDQHLGTATLELADLLTAKTQDHDLELHKGKNLNKPDTDRRIQFSTTFLVPADALKEMGKPQDSDVWTEQDISRENEINWPLLSNLTKSGQLLAPAVAYIESKETGTQAWIYSSELAKVVNVCFRGTEIAEPKDVWTDLSFLPANCSPAMLSRKYEAEPTEEMLSQGARLHSGFRFAYDSIREGILQKVYDITGWDSSWTVCLSGHSLGGALATIGAFEIANRRINQTPKAPPSALQSLSRKLSFRKRKSIVTGTRPNVAMISFGSPRVGNAKFVSLYNETVELSLRVVNPADFVPKLPPSLFYHHTERQLVIKTSGEVKMANRLIQEGAGTEDTSKISATDDRDPNSSTSSHRSSNSTINSHLQPSYFHIINRAVNIYHQRRIGAGYKPWRAYNAWHINGEKLEPIPSLDTSLESSLPLSLTKTISDASANLTTPFG